MKSVIPLELFGILAICFLTYSTVVCVSMEFVLIGETGLAFYARQAFHSAVLGLAYLGTGLLLSFCEYEIM